MNNLPIMRTFRSRKARHYSPKVELMEFREFGILGNILEISTQRDYYKLMQLFHKLC